jgi:cytidylate kinase
MTVVAISASYGAGGSAVGAELARRLDVPFLDRAIPMQVAERLDVSVEDAEAHDYTHHERLLERLLRGFAGADFGTPTAIPAETYTPEDFRDATEKILVQQHDSGEGVIVGRAAVVVLREHPDVLRVRLDGPPEARIRHALRLGARDEHTASRTMRNYDRAQADYARHFYGVDISDRSLYHVVLDSTAIGVEGCVELIAVAAGALAADA